MKTIVLIIYFLLFAFQAGAVVDQKNAPRPEPKSDDLSAEQKALLKEVDTIRDPFVPLWVKKKEIPPEPSLTPSVAPVEPVKPAEPPPLPKVEMPLPTVIQPVEDPFAALMTGSIKVSGVIWNTDMPQAIIDDKVYKVGDEIKGSRISAILKEGIELTSKIGSKRMLAITNDKNN